VFRWINTLNYEEGILENRVGLLRSLGVRLGVPCGMRVGSNFIEALENVLQAGPGGLFAQ
jgi:hypothetical protein